MIVLASMIALGCAVAFCFAVSWMADQLSLLVFGEIRPPDWLFLVAITAIVLSSPLTAIYLDVKAIRLRSSASK